MLQINDRYEFYDELDLDKYDGRYLSPQVRGLGGGCWDGAQNSGWGQKKTKNGGEVGQVMASTFPLR